MCEFQSVSIQLALTMLKYLLFALLLQICLSEKVYDGYKVYDIKIQNEKELNLLKNLETFEGEARDLDFLSFHNNINDVVKLMVKPNEQKFVEDLFKQNELSYNVVSDNAQK